MERNSSRENKHFIPTSCNFILHTNETTHQNHILIFLKKKVLWDWKKTGMELIWSSLAGIFRTGSRSSLSDSTLCASDGERIEKG